MSRNKTDKQLRFERERALYIYSRALEEGDFDVMARIHELAERDPVLERQLAELEEAEAAHLPELALSEDAELVRGLLQRYLTAAEDPVEPAPLTVGEVAGKLLLERRVAPKDAAALAQLQGQAAEVPARLGLSAVRRLGEGLGVGASEHFWRLFREAALLLGVGHSRQEGFAAARRQQAQKDKKEDEK